MKSNVALIVVLAWLAAGGLATGHAEGADTTGIKRKFLDLRYAALSAAQKLDIYLPDAGRGPFPMIVQVHGGGFFEGDKRDMQLSPVLPALKRGYAIVSVNYRLSGEAHFPAAIHDVKAAIRWVRVHAADYTLDPTRVASWGDSAGAHIAVLAAVSIRVPFLTDLRLGNRAASDAVQAAIGWFGPYDFGAMDPQFKASGTGRPMHGGPRSAESYFLGATVEESGALVASANPASYLTVRDPPLLLQAGTMDPIVPVEQSVNFAAAASRVLGADKVTLKLLSGAGHGGAGFESAANLNFVLDWLDRTLQHPSPST